MLEKSRIEGIHVAGMQLVLLNETFHDQGTSICFHYLGMIKKGLAKKGVNQGRGVREHCSREEQLPRMKGWQAGSVCDCSRRDGKGWHGK